MKKRKETESTAMRTEYDFAGGVRGKYVARVGSGGKVVVLDADVAKLFPDSRAVNHALRTLAEVFKGTSRKSKR